MSAHVDHHLSRLSQSYISIQITTSILTCRLRLVQIFVSLNTYKRIARQAENYPLYCQ